ncbi:MAG: crossover junction endodeoxyribonuclease RuvC [bacterium]
MAGIDPGTASLGFAVLEKRGDGWQILACNSLHTEKNVPLEKRLLTLYLALQEIIHKYDPQVIACEEVYFNKNTRTAFIVGSVIGVVLLIAAQADLPIYMYSPIQVKMSVTGYGRASKIQVQEMIARLLKLPQIPKPDDAADALAIAFCHASSAKLKELENKR